MSQLMARYCLTGSRMGTTYPRASPPVTTASLSIAITSLRSVGPRDKSPGYPPSRFYDNTDNRNNGLILNSMLSVDNNKNNFYQPEGWLHLTQLLRL